MANTTDPFAQSVHGTNPQFLVEKITRLKIYNSTYWKEQCFGLTAETIIDKAVALKYVGGNYGGNIKPCNFLCLVLKMLQLQPEKDIVIQFIMNDDFKYVRALGAFYMRLTGKADDVYKYLEPLLNDYRKLAYRGMNGWQSLHMDEFVDNLIRDELVCDIALPHLIKRMKMEELGVLKPRKSAIELEILDAEKENIAEERNENESSAEKFIAENLQHGTVSATGSSSVVKTSSTTVAVAKAVDVEHREERERVNNAGENRDRGQRDSRRYSSRSRTPPGTSRDRDSERRDNRGPDRDRDVTRDSKNDNKRDSRRARSRSRSDSDDSGDRRREKDRSASDRYKSRRDDSRDRHHDRDRDRRGDRRDSGKSRSARDRSDSRDRGRDRDRDRRDKHTPSRDSRRRERSYSYSSASDRSSSRDRRHSKTSKHSGSSRASSSSKRDRDRSYSRDRSASYDRRDSRDKYSSGSGKRRRSASPSSDRNVKRSSATDSYVEKEKDTIKSKEDILPTSAKTTTSSAKPAENKTFDRMFGKKKASSGATSKEIINTKGEKVAITAPEGTVEYWNQIRESLGMSKLK